MNKDKNVNTIEELVAYFGKDRQRLLDYCNKDLQKPVDDENHHPTWFKLKSSDTSEFAIIDYPALTKADRVRELWSGNPYSDSTYAALIMSHLSKRTSGTVLIERFDPHCENIIYLKIFRFIDDLTSLVDGLLEDFKLDKKYCSSLNICSTVELIGDPDDFLFMVQVDIAKMVLKEHGQSGYLAINSPNKLKNKWLIHKCCEICEIAEPKQFLTSTYQNGKKWLTRPVKD